MSRHVDFRNHLNLPFGCVSDDFFHLVLRIESADWSLFSRLLVASCIERLFAAVHAPCAHFCQFGIPFDFEPPSGVIRQMHMQFVEFQHGHTVDEFDHLIFRHEKPCHIQHQSAIGETGLVVYFHGRYAPVCFHLSVSVNCRRQRQTQRLKRIEESGRVRRLDFNLFRSDVHRVGFRCERFVCDKADIALFLVPHIDFGRESGRLSEQFGKIPCRCGLCFIFYRNACAAGECEAFSMILFHCHRFRQYAAFRRRLVVSA